MFISAHPDDIEASAGGLISILTAQKPKPPQIYYVILTNGDKGCAASFCQNWTSEHIAEARHQEALHAATALKVPQSHVVLLDYEDTMLPSYPEQDPRRDLITQIRKYRPDAIFTWYPYPNWALQPSAGWEDLGYHPDHQQAGKLALDAKFDAGVGRLWPDAGPSWVTSEFYMFGFISGQSYVQLTETQVKAKLNAYLQHKTQIPDDSSIILEAFTELTEVIGQATGVPGVTLAEAYIPFF